MTTRDMSRRKFVHPLVSRIGVATSVCFGTRFPLESTYRMTCCLKRLAIVAPPKCLNRATCRDNQRRAKCSHFIEDAVPITNEIFGCRPHAAYRVSQAVPVRRLGSTMTSVKVASEPPVPVEFNLNRDLMIWSTTAAADRPGWTRLPRERS